MSEQQNNQHKCDCNGKKVKDLEKKVILLSETIEKLSKKVEILERAMKR